MTKLTRPVHRITNKLVSGRQVVFTLAPGSDTREDLIGVRLLGQRTQYVITLSDVYRSAALIYARKEAEARRNARRDKVPWRIVKKSFRRNNSIPA